MNSVIVHNVELSKTGLGMSGGETCLVELIKSFDSFSDNGKTIINIIYTPENGIKTYSKFFDNKNNINFVEIGKYNIEKKFGVLFSYLYKTIKSFKYIKKFDNDYNNIIISHSDFWPTTIYAYFLKKKNPSARWFAFNHMLAPNPLKGFKYQYTNKIKFPSLKNIHYWLNQRLFFCITKKANGLITVNSSYIEYFKKFNKNVILIKLSSDIDQYIGQLIKNNKKYDACFIGRFHEQKGVFELIDIIKKVKKYNNQFKCIVVGDYNNKIGKEFIKKIKANNLNDNFELVGLKIGLDKYKILNDSKCFLFPSYYESFGIVYLEAISLGVPVFEYDLPIYQDHKYGVVKIPFLNNEIFSQQIVNLLKDKNAYDKLSYQGLEYSKLFSWPETARLIFNNFK